MLNSEQIAELANTLPAEYADLKSALASILVKNFSSPASSQSITTLSAEIEKARATARLKYDDAAQSGDPARVRAALRDQETLENLARFIETLKDIQE